MSFLHDQKMYEKGYRYKIDPKNHEFDPLYSKTLHNIGPLLRSYPEHRFDISKIVYDWKISDLFKLWKDNQSVVINLLAEEHAGLTAACIAQGFADGMLKAQDLNKIANLLIEKRMTPA